MFLLQFYVNKIFFLLHLSLNFFFDKNYRFNNSLFGCNYMKEFSSICFTIIFGHLRENISFLLLYCALTSGKDCISVAFLCCILSSSKSLQFNVSSASNIPLSFQGLSLASVSYFLLHWKLSVMTLVQC